MPLSLTLTHLPLGKSSPNIPLLCTWLYLPSLLTLTQRWSRAVVRTLGCQSDGPSSILHWGWTLFHTHPTSRWSIMGWGVRVKLRTHWQMMRHYKGHWKFRPQGRHEYTCRHHYPLSPDAVRWVKGRVARSLIGPPPPPWHLPTGLWRKPDHNIPLLCTWQLHKFPLFLLYLQRTQRSIELKNTQFVNFRVSTRFDIIQNSKQILMTCKFCKERKHGLYNPSVVFQLYSKKMRLFYFLLHLHFFLKHAFLTPEHGHSRGHIMFLITTFLKVKQNVLCQRICPL